MKIFLVHDELKINTWSKNKNFLNIPYILIILLQLLGKANDLPEIAQRIFKKVEKLIGATGFEPAT